MKPIRYRCSCYACGKVLSLDKPTADLVLSRGLPLLCQHCDVAPWPGGSVQGLAPPALGPAQGSGPSPPEQA